MSTEDYKRRQTIYGIDHIEWNPEPIAEVAREIEAADPYCIRAANFFTRTLDLLGALSEPRVVLWKMEFWGTDTPYEKVPRSENIDPDTYVKEIMASGHHVIPYTFNTWGRDRLYSVAPSLRDHTVELLPIAQKPPGARDHTIDLRSGIGIDRDCQLVGCGGLLHPAKGIEGVVESFLASYPDPHAHLMCALVIEEDEETAQDVLRRWSQEFGESVLRRVHVRTGPYGDWGWMCEFYRAIDVMLVNSLSDSWGRMVAEPLGLGVPTIVRRADCGTNHIAPGVTFVDSFAGLDAGSFASAIRQAQASAPQLSDYVRSRYALPLLRERFIDTLSRHIPDAARRDFVLHAARFGSDLDEFIVY